MNKLEVISDCAEVALIRIAQIHPSVFPNGLYKTDNNDPGVTHYTEEAQDEFNLIYDAIDAIFDEHNS